MTKTLCVACLLALLLTRRPPRSRLILRRLAPAYSLN